MNQAIMRRAAIPALTFLFLVGISIYAWGGETTPAIDPKPAEGYRIIRTAEGYEPSSLVIPMGEVVTFISRDRDSWPASNIHPTHDIYPAFDSRGTVKEGEQWPFTFAEAGRYRFHDHLEASATGVIVVVGKETQRQPTNLHDCEPVPVSVKQQCWDDLLAYTLKQNGVAAAFDLFSELYRTEPDVPKACHGWGHALGRAAYEMYRDGEDIELHPEAAYCGYGFYHGFLERLVGETGDAKEAYVFCRGIRESPSANASAYNNCIHGIGHGGAASIIERREMEGKYQESLDQGIALCRSFLTDVSDLRNCFDGVFNELVLDMWNGKYGLERAFLFSATDPLAFCKKQEPFLQTSCNFEYMGVFEQVFAGDFERAARYVMQTITNEGDASIAMNKLAADFMQSDIVNSSYAENVRVCRLLSPHLSSACINGIEVGLMAHGEPKREYEKVFAFCGSDLLSEQESARCFTRMIIHFKDIYDEELFEEVCKSVPDNFRNQCGA